MLAMCLRNAGDGRYWRMAGRGVGETGGVGGKGESGGVGGGGGIGEDGCAGGWGGGHGENG